MAKHLSEGQIKNFISRKLPPGELLQVDDHLAVCEICMLKTRAHLKPTEALEGMLWANTGYDHLNYEQMSGFIDNSLVDADREIVELHQKTCEECLSEIVKLRKIHDELANTSTDNVRQARRSESTWLDRIFANPYFKVAIPVMGVLVLAAVVWMFEKRNDQTIAEVSGPVQPSPTSSIENEAPGKESGVNSATEDNKIVASLNDAGGKVEMDETGKVNGLQAGDLEPKVRAALKDQTVEIPTGIKQLRTTSGVLMGDSDTGVPFKLHAPVGIVVESRRPTFSWQLLKDASSYKVGIYDENFNEAAASPELHSTSWTPNVSLKRGRIYQWQVTAIRNGQEVKSPVRPAPEAKFKVADEAGFAAIEKARRSAPNSHLLLGIAYANAGLIDQAEREFQALVNNNPNSDIARKLLAKVKAVK